MLEGRGTRRVGSHVLQGKGRAACTTPRSRDSALPGDPGAEAVPEREAPRESVLSRGAYERYKTRTCDLHDVNVAL